MISPNLNDNFDGLSFRTEIDLPHVSDFVRLENSDSFLSSHVYSLRVKEEGASTSSNQALLRVSTEAYQTVQLIPSFP